MIKNKPLYPLLLIIGLYLVISLSRSIYSLTQKTKDVDVLKNQVDKELSENNRLNQALTEAKSQKFIEQQAREKLNMAKKGETVVVIPSELITEIASREATESSLFFNPPEKIPNWKKWWRLFF